MSSLRSHIFRMILKSVVGPKIKRAANSITQLRGLEHYLIKNQRLPPDVEVSFVEAGGTNAEWIRAPRAQTDAAVLYFHGGAFVMGSPATHRELASRLSAVTNTIVLSLDYRLAPEHPFPAAMQDAISAYYWLLSEGYTANRIVLGGDSSGGGLALQTLLALRNKGVPLPAAAIFFSPQTDWVHFDGDSYSSHAHSDPLMTPEMCRFTASQYVGDNDPKDPLLSPVNVEMSGLPPLCIHVGDQELLLSDAVRFAERARAAQVNVELQVWPGMWHVFQTAARFVPEARQSLEATGRFVADQVALSIPRA